MERCPFPSPSHLPFSLSYVTFLPLSSIPFVSFPCPAVLALDPAKQSEKEREGETQRAVISLAFPGGAQPTNGLVHFELKILLSMIAHLHALRSMLTMRIPVYCFSEKQ